MKHTVMYKNLELEIDGGVLCSMHNGGAPREVIIPKILPNGEQISKIGSEFLKGEYKLVVISDEITRIADAAFKYAKVEIGSCPKSVDKSKKYGIINSSKIKR